MVLNMFQENMNSNLPLAKFWSTCIINGPTGILIHIFNVTMASCIWQSHLLPYPSNCCYAVLRICAWQQFFVFAQVNAIAKVHKLNHVQYVCNSSFIRLVYQLKVKTMICGFSFICKKSTEKCYYYAYVRLYFPLQQLDSTKAKKILLSDRLQLGYISVIHITVARYMNVNILITTLY